MNEHGLPCRRCGQVAGNVTVVYGKDEVGTLVPRAAQCSPRCPQKAPRAPERSRPADLTPITAIRPGLCPACTWDIVPGDKIVHLGEGRLTHLECAPAEAPRPQRRDRSRVPAVRAKGVVV